MTNVFGAIGELVRAVLAYAVPGFIIWSLVTRRWGFGQ
jgi:hypothetical protein